MIEPRDVVLAILGASAGLGGFVLVFLGVMVASYQSYAGGVPDQVVQPYRTTGGVLFATFGLSLANVALCLVWLVLGGPATIYSWTVGLFLVLLVVVFLAAGWATRTVLWR